MRKPSQIIILCEDRAHEVFIKRFLKKGFNVHNRAIRVPSYPSGKGSGKKFVKDKVAVEAEAMRKRHTSTILLVIVDADEHSVEQVKSELNKRLQPSRNESEPIVYIIPKWHIETWIAYLNGDDVDEDDKDIYKKKYGKIAVQKEVHQYIDKLANECSKNIQLKSPPASLLVACEEFNRIRGAL